MSLSTKFSHKLMVHPALEAGGVLVEKEHLSVTPDGFDSLTLDVFAVSLEVTTPEAMARLYPIGTAASACDFIDWAHTDEDSLWFVQGVQFQSAGAPGCWKGTIDLKGVVDVLKPYSMTIDATSSDYESTNTIIGGTTYARVATQERELTMSLAYVQVGVPETDLVGEEGVPLYSPLLADDHWISLASPLYHWPNGWVMEKMPIRCLAGVDPALLHYRTDNWIYKRSLTP